MGADAEIRDYFAVLQQLPFVEEAVEVARESRVRGEPWAPDLEILLRTPGGDHRLLAEVKASHLTTAQVAAIIARTPDPERWILMAPAIGAGLGEMLEEHGLNFVDLVGNCFVRLGPGYVARLQRSTTPARSAAQKGIRAAGYQALFALLAKPELMRATVREIAAEAGVSRTAVSDLLARLVDEGLAVRTHRKHEWAAHRIKTALDMWVHGYSLSVRPKFFLGAFRAREESADALERHIDRGLRGVCDWRFGGAAAAHRIEGHYRGQRTVVHLVEPPGDVARQLAVARDPNGPLVLLGVPGPVALEGVTPDTVHPLLAYSELLMEHHDRATEAAQRVLEKFPVRP